jgi:hypothetical protein
MNKLVITPLFILLFITGCKKSNNPVEPSTSAPNNGVNISLGSTVSVMSQTIDNSGGTISVNSSGSPVNGLQINIPSNAYTESHTFSISYATILSHKFGQNFNPVSPMISIKNGGGYSSLPMTITVPVKKAKTDFALGFLYNEITGSLEALPVLAESDSTVTVMTSHFETSSLTIGKRLAKGAVDNSAVGNLIFASLSLNVLTNQTVINTNFTPGVDDWEFINYGSFIAPKGHCAGQSITAMWYYYEKKPQLGKLFHSLDKLNNPASPSFMWMDNPLGYRFASTIQDDFNWDFWIYQVNISSFFPTIVWDTFIGAMLITGQPQFVIICNSAGKGAHAMIVYKIDITQGKLYIADPNFPNNYDPNGVQSVRTINYVNGAFQPYPSALNAASSQVMFDQIAFFGKTSNINWSQISNRWNDVQNKIIGNDRFPTNVLYYQLGNNQTNISDSLTISADTLFVSTNLGGIFSNGTITGYNENGGAFPPSKTVIQSGTHYYGYYVSATPRTDPPTQGPRFIDFKWIKITKQSSYTLAYIYLQPVDQTQSFITLSDNSNVSTTVGWSNKVLNGNVSQNLTWVGNNFSVNYAYSDTVNAMANLIAYISGSISGTLDPVNNIIDSLSATESSTGPAPGAGSNQSIVLKNVPVTISNNSVNTNIPNGGAQSYVKSFKLSSSGIDYSGNPYTYSIQSVNWANVYLSISLSK